MQRKGAGLGPFVFVGGVLLLALAFGLFMQCGRASAASDLWWNPGCEGGDGWATDANATHATESTDVHGGGSACFATKVNGASGFGYFTSYPSGAHLSGDTHRLYGVALWLHGNAQNIGLVVHVSCTGLGGAHSGESLGAHDVYLGSTWQYDTFTCTPAYSDHDYMGVVLGRCCDGVDGEQLYVDDGSLQVGAIGGTDPDLLSAVSEVSDRLAFVASVAVVGTALLTGLIVAAVLPRGR